MRVLVIDVGGSHVKVFAGNRRKPVEIPSGRNMTARRMVDSVLKEIAGWEYDVVSIGYPGRVKKNRPVANAPNLGGGWVRFDFQHELGKPVKIMNDAALQALGSYSGGRMLFLGLGTGLGSTLIVDDVLHPTELGDLPYRDGHSYADYLGKSGLKRLGRAKWVRHVKTAVAQLREALQVDYVVLGGGKAKLVPDLPKGVRRGDNSKAYDGGVRAWQRPHAREGSRAGRSRASAVRRQPNENGNGGVHHVRSAGM